MQFTQGALRRFTLAPLSHSEFSLHDQAPRLVLSQIIDEVAQGFLRGHGAIVQQRTPRFAPSHPARHASRQVDILELVLLALAAFVAGAINAVAGGGSLISFPALVAAGYPAKTANVTNSVALWPGYLSGSWGYRGELRLQRSRIVALTIPSVLGALAGSVILLSTPQSAFDVIVPFLILFACIVMAFQERLARFADHRGLASRGYDHIPASLHVSIFALAVYGAYFGAGLGILTLAFLGIFLPDDIQRSNALKGLLSALINFVAVVYFAAFGPVEWAPAAAMAVGALAGGYLGVGVARRLGRERLRFAVIGYGLLVAAVLFVQLFL
jgi:uncharacterized membrane protein YfcA